MGNQKLLSEELSSIGKINIVLRGKTTELFNVLEKDGLIQNLKSIKHLGVISLSHTSSRHTRWDYVCLMLFLTQKIWGSTLLTGLGTTIRSLGISGEELIQSFVLLSNIGHLEGTISSEKGLMKFLLENDIEKNNFLKNIDPQEYSELIDNCFTKYDFYKIKYLITLNYLHKINQSDFIKIFNTFIDNSIEKDSPQIGKLKKLYFRIRQLSFLFLDSSNSSFPVNLNIHKVLLNIEEYEDLFNPNSNSFDSFLEHYENSLTKNLYISPDSSWVHSRNVKYNYEYFKKHKDQIEFDNFIISIQNHKKDKNGFKIDKEYVEFVFQPYISVYDIFDLRNFLSYDFVENSKKLISNEKKLNKILNKKLTIKSNDICILNDNRKNIVFLNFIIKKFDFEQVSDYHQLIHNLNQCLFLTYESFTFFDQHREIRDYVNNILFKSVVRKYLQFVVELLVKNSFSLPNQDEIITYVKYEYHRIIQTKRFPTTETFFISDKKEMLIKMDHFINDFELYSDIQNNIKLIKTILNQHTKFSRRFYLLSCNLPIEIEKKEFQPELLKKTILPEKRESVTDIDVVLILFNKSGYELYFIEGKNTRSGLENKVNQNFQKIIDIMEYPNTFTDSVVINNGNEGKGGFLRIRYPK
jgi:hypothetical protein